MITIYGDSWGFSFINKPNYDGDICFGKNLSECLSEITGKVFVNKARRRQNNREICDSIENFPSLVLQTDPLRDELIGWADKNKPIRRYSFPEKFNPLSSFTINDFAKHRLELFYKRLEGKNIILFGGCSKIDFDLAKKYNLKCIDKTATEILMPEFEDCFFFEYNYTLRTHEELKKSKFYNSEVSYKYCRKVGEKNLLWKDNPDLFSTLHAREKSNFIIAEYLSSWYLN